MDELGNGDYFLIFFVFHCLKYFFVEIHMQ
jgi:hypothetical protein